MILWRFNSHRRLVAECVKSEALPNVEFQLHTSFSTFWIHFDCISTVLFVVALQIVNHPIMTPQKAPTKMCVCKFIANTIVVPMETSSNMSRPSRWLSRTTRMPSTETAPSHKYKHKCSNYIMSARVFGFVRDRSLKPHDRSERWVIFERMRVFLWKPGGGRDVHNSSPPSLLTRLSRSVDCTVLIHESNRGEVCVCVSSGYVSCRCTVWNKSFIKGTLMVNFT